MNTAPDSAPAPVVHEFREPGAALHAFVALDDLRLGPAFGGCRFRRYPDIASARADAERLAAGMTLKNALAGIPFGGGKAVILEPSGPYDRGALFEAFGAAVDRLRGQYVTAMDSGTETADMDTIARRTRFVSGGTGAEGDPSPFTALGVLRGIEAALASRGGELRGARVAIQGTGHVGAALAHHLAAAGADLIVADPVAARAEAVAAATGARILPPEDLPFVECDVFAPCGLGGVLSAEVVDRLACRVVAGAANNQLASPAVAGALARRDVLYVPDFVLNAGGVIHAALAWSRASTDEIGARVERIGATVAEVLARAGERGLLPVQVAVELAEARLRRA